MRRAVVKKIKIPISSGEDGVAEMFNQMLGTGTVNMDIAYPRYVRMRKLCEQLVKLFELLSASPFMQYADFNKQKEQIDAFCKKSRDEIKTLFRADLSDIDWDLNAIEEELKANFSKIYLEMKQSQLIDTFILMCDRLVPHKKNFVDINRLSHKFIGCMAGVEWCPFPFTNLNYKYIFSLTLSPTVQAFFMTVLNKAFDLSYQLFTERQAPDIDVNQFVDFIMKSIDEIQTRPEVCRCKEAFQKIKESVEMLRDRFDSYYRDFISAKDSSIMMQHFILDVSKNTTASPKVAKQFKTIIGYYQSIASSDQIKDPKIKMLFDNLNKSLSEFEKGKENLVNIRNEEEDDVPNDSEPILMSCAPRGAS